ncbi:hypothetical protein AAG906_000332 [Vitis piasezkii]|uniref:F-box/LRR-repeat protein n=3 Tax=Vitis vinifera TaxID=29760 RepID=A0A438HGR7_VITVI|nr:F-box/LRR-repeat protein At3g48880 isoform X2 [Vitis vinifera]RVW31807.1 F-box/LRR-repeat protein [Vitis vinifera]RVW83644.1 F-box/LRR-repeat protein [Vitis vinifera]WKA11816.1 hypothetical protein VitviT2T_029278 [Vitis vinifera]|eukprot:XP_010643992.1 PREDICTED: F-box/LRR-repeat protein At3g48880 isoform X2 [Vitis vinifera]
MEERKWDELNMDCLANVFQKVGMLSLLFDVPFVCKSWYKASLNPMCWQHLVFPDINPSDMGRQIPVRLLIQSTSVVKLVVNRSSGCATTLALPKHCSEKALEYAAKKCPALKILVLHDFMPHESSILIPKLISKWKNLEVLSLRWSYNMADIIPQIGFHCKKFVQLNAPNSIIGKDESSAMVTFVPNIRHLFLKGSGIKQENLVIILQGCKELVSLDVSDCIGFKDDDAEILQLASHIPAFVCEGSRILIPQLTD